MTDVFSYLFLQQYWWCIFSLLSGMVIFMLFVYGGQILIHQIGRTDMERAMMIQVLGHKWGMSMAVSAAWMAVAWAAFPLFFAVSMSGALWIWILILLCYVSTGCAFEFSRKATFTQEKSAIYDKILMMSGFNGALAIGILMSTFFTGSPFAVDIHPQSGLMIPTWVGIMGGLELALDLSHYTSYINISLGVAFLFLAVILGALFLKYRIDNEDIERRTTKVIRGNMPFFILFFAFFLVNIWVRPGYEYSQDEYITLVYGKYLENMYDMPALAAVLGGGIILLIFGFVKGCRMKDRRGFLYSGAGCIMSIFALMCSAGLNNTVFYPASGQWIQNGLTIENSSAGIYSMSIMFFISLVFPFVLAYVIYVWRKIDRSKVNKGNFSDE